MRDEHDWEGACDAYEAILAAGAAAEGRGAERIARSVGFQGKVGRWDARGAARELARLREIAQRGPLRLDCHCEPRRCHAEAVAAALRA